MTTLLHRLISLHERKPSEKTAALVESAQESSPSLRKSFLEALIKAGEGSRGGHVTGHTAGGKPIYGSPAERKPYPGEEAHQMEPNAPQQRKTYMPPEGTMAHYADTSNLRAYKNLIRMFKQKGQVFQGHITYNPGTDKVETMSPQGAQIVKQILEEFKSKQGPAGKSEEGK